MSNPPRFDPSIPVLTEVFQDQAEAPAPPPPAPAPPPPSRPDPAAALEARAVAGWSEPEWTLLERRLCERLLSQLQNRADFVLEQRVRDCIEEVVGQAVGALAAELKKGLHQTFEQIVTRAVAQELAHLHSLKN